VRSFSDFSRSRREMKEKMMNRIRQITIETHSITIIRKNGRRLSVHCERCRETVTAFTPEQITKFLQLNLTEVCRRIETQQIHLTNDGDNVALVCGNSLADFFKQEIHLIED
jgi:hypothetical protein